MNPFPWWGDLIAGTLSLYCSFWVWRRGAMGRNRWTALSFAVIGIAFIVVGLVHELG